LKIGWVPHGLSLSCRFSKPHNPCLSTRRGFSIRYSVSSLVFIWYIQHTAVDFLAHFSRLTSIFAHPHQGHSISEFCGVRLIFPLFAASLRSPRSFCSSTFLASSYVYVSRSHSPSRSLSHSFSLPLSAGARLSRVPKCVLCVCVRVCVRVCWFVGEQRSAIENISEFFSGEARCEKCVRACVCACAKINMKT